MSGAATFNKGEWEGVQKVLQEQQASENANYRDCVKKLTPLFLDKFGPPKRKANNKVAADISPQIKCKLEYRYKVEKGAVRRQIDNPSIILTNIGPIKAVALSVDHNSYLYDIKSEKIESEFRLFKETHDHLIFVKELQPSEDIKQELNGVRGKGKVLVHKFTMKYYRELDMKLFTRQYTFFIEDYNIFSEDEYSKNKKHRVILQAIKDRTTKNSEQICFLGVDDHTWVVKETPKTGIFVLGEDGKSYAMADASADPLTLIQREKLDKNRPFLYVMPWRFNKTGNYINPEVITDDLLNVELQFQVENIGDKEATDISFTDGEPYTKPLRPGEKIYYKNQVTLERKAGAKAQELIKKERYLTYGTTVAYRPESGNKGYITRFLYEIGEDEVRLIKYEVQ